MHQMPCRIDEILDFSLFPYSLIDKKIPQQCIDNRLTSANWGLCSFCQLFAGLLCKKIDLAREKKVKRISFLWNWKKKALEYDFHNPRHHMSWVHWLWSPERKKSHMRSLGHEENKNLFDAFYFVWTTHWKSCEIKAWKCLHTFKSNFLKWKNRERTLCCAYFYVSLI